MADKEKATSFQLTYVVDGQVCYVETVEKGTRLSSAPKPVKEFHTFSGWDKIPSRMPARDVEVNGSFTPNSYKLSFVAGEVEVWSTTLPYGAPVEAPEATSLEGYTFLGWADLPETMPGADTVVHASFEANEYQLTYVIKDATETFPDTMFVYPVKYGTVIEPMDIPQREFCSFSGWADLPETMPAHDVTVTGSLALTLFKLTRIVDGEIFKEEYLPFGAPVSKKPNPEKEGYYFSGFRKLPKTMPDHDVEVVSSMYPARFKADFFLDGDFDVSKYFPFGSPVQYTPEPRDGYVFGGWDDCPETMPAHDVEIHGKMVRSEFRVIYRARGREIHVDTYLYGAPVVAAAPIDIPGFSFVAWNGLPETMPEHDVYVDGEYKLNVDRVSFLLDGQEYSSFDGTDAYAEPTPDEREGYTFGGWGDGELDENGALVLHGSYVPNVYTLSFRIDGEIVATETLAFGDPISAPTPPSKDNRTFMGWTDLPEFMPDSDLTVDGEYADSVYRIEFVVDGVIVAEFVRSFGAPIEAPEAPEKEGYTFTGWIDPPAVMPDYDLRVNGMYTLNSYKLTYVLDGETYAEQTYEYGAEIEAPTPESGDGQTFGGWQDLPATMPACDTTVSGLMGGRLYTVTFLSEEDVFATLEIAEGTAITAPEATPVKQGYTFTAWEGMPEAMPAEDITVRASFEQNRYTLSFVVGEEAVYTATYAFGEDVVAPADLVVDDPAFSGWTEIPVTMPDADVTVSAKMDRRAYTVTFTVDGETVSEISLYPGQQIELPAVGSKEGHTFAGWRGYVAEMPADDLTVFGAYVPNPHTVSFMADDALFTQCVVAYGEAPVAPAVPTKAGFVCNGWQDLPEVMPDADVTAVALFAEAEAVEEAPAAEVEGFTVRFVASGETVSEQTVAQGATVEAPAAPYKFGYTFVKWEDLPAEAEADATVRAQYMPNAHTVIYLDQNVVVFEQTVNFGDPVIVPDELDKESYAALPAVMPDHDVIVSAGAAVEAEAVAEEPAAVETPAPVDVPTYNLIFMCCGREFHSERLPAGAAIAAPALQYESDGVIYDSWTACPETMPAEDTVVYAQVKATGGVVTYVCEGNTISTLKVSEGAAIPTVEMPEREGYVFGGWSSAPETMGNEDITVVGEYVPKMFSVTYKVKGQPYATEQYAYGSEITPIKAPVVKKRAFVSWQNLPSVMPAENLVSEGLYVTQNTFLLSFRIDGEPYAESVLEPGTRILMPAAPVKDGFTFSGWDKNVTVIGREPIIVNGHFEAHIRTATYLVAGEEYAKYEVPVGDVIPVPEEPQTQEAFRGWSDHLRIMPNRDVTFEAQLGAVYTIVFMADGHKIDSVVVREGESVAAIEAPVKAGYAFDGWDGLPEVATADCVVTANYKPLTFHVTFNVADEVYAAADVLFGHAIELPAEPTVEGYTFLGWDSVPETMPAEDVTVSAQLEAIVVEEPVEEPVEEIDVPEIVEPTPAYTVTFTVGDEVYASYEVEVGAAINAPADPETEMAFCGWTEYPSEMPAEDVTVSAILVPVYTVTFLADGETVAELRIKENDPVEAPEAPAKAGYNFIAWTDLPEVATADVVCHAEYEQILRTVTFMVGEQVFATLSLPAGAAIELPEMPEGETLFDGWGEIPAEMPDEDIVLTAQFREPEIVEEPVAEEPAEEIVEEPVAEEPAEEIVEEPVAEEPAEEIVEEPVEEEPVDETLYTVTFFLGEEIYATAQYKAGDAILVPDAPTSEDFIFNGWTDLPETMPAEDLSVVADVTACCNAVRFMIGEELISEIKLAPGMKIDPPAVPEKVGYTFAGWGDLPVKMGDESLVINGMYQPNVHRVRFMVGKKIVSNIEVPYGEAIPCPADPVKDNYTFFGWKDIPDTMPDEDVKLQAIFECVFPVVYVIDDEVFHEDLLAPRTKIVPPEVPEKYGHTFSGWSEHPKKVRHEKIVINGSFVPNPHTVTFMNGEEVHAKLTVAYGELIPEVEIPFKEAYVFVKWNGLPETMPNEDMIIEAEFAVCSNRVVFLLDGIQLSEAMVDYGAIIPCPAVQQRMGYTFSGWDHLPEKMPNCPLVIEGTYRINQHRAVFMANKEIFFEAVYKYGETIEEPDTYPESKKRKLQFYRWDQIPERMGDEDVVINAVFEKASVLKKYMKTVTFRVNDKVVDKISVLPGRKIKTPSEPYKSGFAFVGWSNLPDVMPDKDLVTDALFEAKVCTVTFLIDNEVYYKASLPVGAIVPKPVPRRIEGMTFVRWQNLAEKMPGYDFTVEALYERNAYTLVYMVGKEVYRKVTYLWGDSIKTLFGPDRAESRFIGWQNLPQTMPMHDVTVTAMYRRKEFKVTYILDDKQSVYNTTPFGNTIIPPAVGVRNGKGIIDWKNLPKDRIMPAHDLVVTAVWGSARAAAALERKRAKYAQNEVYTSYDDPDAPAEKKSGKPVSDKKLKKELAKEEKKANKQNKLDGAEYARMKMRKLMK